MSDNSIRARMRRYATVPLDAIQRCCDRIEQAATDVGDGPTVQVVGRIRDELRRQYDLLDEYHRTWPHPEECDDA